MSTEYPTLAEVRDIIAQAICGPPIPWDAYTEGTREHWRVKADAVLGALREACAIRTVEQLDALPEFAIVGIHMPIGDSRRQPHLYAIERDGEWFGVGNGYEITRDELTATLEKAAALLLWHPDWSK